MQLRLLQTLQTNMMRTSDVRSRLYRSKVSLLVVSRELMRINAEQIYHGESLDTSLTKHLHSSKNFLGNSLGQILITSTAI